MELLTAAREGASYEEMGAIVCTSGQTLRRWVREWYKKPPDRPQARFARVIANYNPPSHNQKEALSLVDEVLRIHDSSCECGREKDDPHDPVCRNCAVMENQKA